MCPTRTRDYQMKTQTFTSLRLFFAALFVILSSAAFAQKNIIGSWQSNTVDVFEGERITLFFDFKDTESLEMAFVMEKAVPGKGRCVSRASIQGTYSFIGPFFSMELDKTTLDLKIEKLELEGEIETLISKDSKNELRACLQSMLKEKLTQEFADVDEAGMIYITHEGTEDEFSFIFGDKNDSLALDFTRQE